MITAIEESNRIGIYFIGDIRDIISLRQFIDLISMMIRKLDEIDPMKVYRREWEENGGKTND